ncbi:Alkaline phosphatase-like protein [Thiocapsa sp. KS1]|jgi:hypothetical protein|nr:choice-of-anchor I family protein [Thiocapsa sp. KS1]CRI65035.1 Alkaline phosphatase-like protein [Thiocapsa sp. KS1]
MSFTTVSRLAAGCALALGVAATQASPPAAPFAIEIAPIGTYASGVFARSGAEIVAHDPRSQRLFVVNAASGLVDVLGVHRAANPRLLFSIDLSEYGAVVNSVTVHDGLVVAVVANAERTKPGRAVFMHVDGRILASVEVGALPDMVTFTPDGKRVLVANEGEPNDDYSVDPEGSVSIVDLPRNIRKLAQANVRTADFRKFNDAALDPSVRVFGPNASVAQDFEPEYITVAKNSKTAWVSLQENNAVAVLDIKSGDFTAIHGLGFKDHSLAGNALDASDRDEGINIVNWPILGMYLPDAIASYEHRGRTYIVSANEGDARDYDGFGEEARVKDLALDPSVFPDADALQEDENLGRLTVTTTGGVDPVTGMQEQLYAFGGRSFSIWSAELEQVYDSGADFERITADAYPEFFNSDHEENKLDNRSDNKGPEPEGVTVAKLWGRTYAFVGLERIGGVMVYDITDPFAPTFVQYLNNRDFGAEPGTPEAGDLGAEGLTVIEASKSPIRGVPLLVVANEVSGTTTLFRIERVRR